MVTNKHKLISAGLTERERRLRRDMLTIVESVLADVDPQKVIKEAVTVRDGILRVKDATYDLHSFEHIYVVGAGKGAYGMALAVEKLLGRRITAGHINVQYLPVRTVLKKIRVTVAGHPMPNAAGVRGSRKILSLVKAAGSRDLVIALISGGGSALMPLPSPGIKLSEKVVLTSLLLKTPATIQEINIVRRHLSQIKGGQLATAAYPARVIGLYMSDIIAKPFDYTASRPTAPDDATFADAIRILKNHRIWDRAPARVRRHLIEGAKGLVPETPNKRHEMFSKHLVYNCIIADHRTSLASAARKARSLGYRACAYTSLMSGEARNVSKKPLKAARRFANRGNRPAVLIATGETTVTVLGKGKGGRNQELVLSVTPLLKNGVVLLSIGTDGVDGINPKLVAGALADGSTVQKAHALRLPAKRYLVSNDSYHFFEKIGSHIVTGHTGTNVGDLVLIGIR
ncbi:MAG: DUF4147 domain-containing protein [Parcubacteria group bacterium]